LKGTDIPLEARIFAIADVFDALTSSRPYKEPYSYEETMALMQKGRASHFDPVLFDIFEPIAEQLYNTYANSEDDKLKTEFQTITDRYFHCDIKALKS
jgi:HD-GYP domain-containing protein (c-di-GMP phosphodiesterase class II)